MPTSTSDPLASSPEAFLKDTARSIGFDSVRITRADEPWTAGERLEAFVADGRHGQMEWMETTLERRKAPTAMWAGAKSAVVVALNYGPGIDPMELLDERSVGNISVYARGRDYHDLVKSRLKQLARAFVAKTGAEVKVFVDTAPLMEKPLAAKAGMGWQGKHTNLVSRELGSWFFLGVMLTEAELQPDATETDHCGSCRACLDVCPTQAFPAPYQLDARRCISYLTIEHAGPIPREFRAAMGNRIYGCDDCLAVCPWNKFAEAASEAALHARAELKTPGLDELAALDDATFREVFSGSPIKRSGRTRFVRNVCVAIGNSADARLVPSLLGLLDDEAPDIRGAAIWALARLDPDRFAAEKAARMAEETDPGVVAEWEGAA
ncbi:MAG: tRNA epoxyqueuosine(34) reductase QueG [Alphaproteobacteria bacterium]|nr:tRNA epoxyqueuosine(34) reductase QueG [Alphaproteobacteria bacterium]MBU2082451.1 tRNA epoxyqueuosine(34) reductase QueG [Alphaproteobacteria bacterium]MBU2141462.1 tRNA epoxyqueuosine(34) reductase QueG [Alphaproteobacteria bacterium]MBU2197908.1 tRNA epoxyqueuosine(34) reductase QueG [Alphaproteobacteria bacterium]